MAKVVRLLISSTTAVVVATGLGGIAAPAAYAAPAQADDPVAAASAAYKATHDTDPHSPLSAADRQALAGKSQQAQEHMQAKLAARQGSGGSDSAVAMAQYAANEIPLTQQPQQTSYYCGPATVSELLGARGVSYSQSSSAYLLRTTTDGTAWYGVDARVPNPTSRPIRDVLNYLLNTSFYIPVDLPYSPSSTDKANYRSRLTYDIDAGWGISANAWEVTGGYHLTGHPNIQIFHHYAVFGYTNYGAGTTYADSVHGATSISWSGGVPAYTYGYDSDHITVINGGRGYIW
jgi:hypothetical protein